MKYIIDGSTTATITPPSGLMVSVNNVEFQLAGTVTVTDYNGSVTIPGNNVSLPLQYANTIVISATGGPINVDVSYTGDQFAYRNMDSNIKPQSAGFYPGHWGTGIGSKPRTNDTI